MTSSHLDVYKVVRETRTRYVVRVLARNSAEACRKADEHFAATATAPPQWGADELGRRIEATLLDKVSREDALR